ncbi:MAG: hypothetical protein AAB885_01810, partial [Patescibacteria group bacterium]
GSYIKLEKEKRIRYHGKDYVWTRPIRIKDPKDPNIKKLINQWVCPICLPQENYVTESKFSTHMNNIHFTERKVELNTVTAS